MLKYISLKEEHSKLIFSWRMRPHVTKFMLTNLDDDVEKHKKWIKSKIDNQNCKYWLISYDNIKVGLVNLSDIDYVNKRCTVGYYIGEKEFMGLGAMFLPLVYDYIFYKLKLNKIYGEVLEGNNMILGIHRYHGWRNVGLFNKHIYKSGKFYDVHLLELLGSDWINYSIKKRNVGKNYMFKSDVLFDK